jgi:hypothetical protein
LRENNREERLAKREKAMAMIKVRSESDVIWMIVHHLLFMDKVHFAFTFVRPFVPKCFTFFPLTFVHICWEQTKVKSSKSKFIFQLIIYPTINWNYVWTHNR